MLVITVKSLLKIAKQTARDSARRAQRGRGTRAHAPRTRREVEVRGKQPPAGNLSGLRPPTAEYS
jgi:hypothetical protein